MERYTVENIRVYSIPLDWVETLTLSFVVRAGSANESDSRAGVSHFLEHVSFRGSERFDMRHIKFTVESVGGTLNAFTGRTYTVYYFRVPDFKSKDAFEVLEDLVFRPRIDPEDVEIERKIILEEYGMSQETPEDRLHDMALESVWGSPYGRPIMGYESTITSITADDIRDYHDRMYTPSRISILMIGKPIDLNGLLDPPGSRDQIDDPEEPSFSNSGDNFQTMRDLKQVHFLLLRESPGLMNPNHTALEVLNTMLGSGMSSYLFEEIREKRGLVYDISTEMFSLKSTGLLGVYFSTSPDNAHKTLEEVVGALERFDVSEYIDYGRERLLGKLKMLTESPGGLMGFFLERLSLGFEPLDPSDKEEMVRSVTRNEIESLSSELLKGKWRIFAVGPENFRLDRKFAEI